MLCSHSEISHCILVISAVDLSTSTADYSAITSVDIAIGDRFVDFQFVLVDGDTTEITEFVEIVASAGGVSTTATVTVYDESNFGSKGNKLYNLFSTWLGL